MATNLADRLAGALGSERKHTAIVVHAAYQPVGGAGRSVMPPTYPVDDNERDPNARYLLSERLVDGERRPTVVIDQEPSQANRVEEALRDARDAGLLRFADVRRLGFPPQRTVAQICAALRRGDVWP